MLLWVGLLTFLPADRILEFDGYLKAVDSPVFLFVMEWDRALMVVLGGFWQMYFSASDLVTSRLK